MPLIQAPRDSRPVSRVWCAYQALHSPWKWVCFYNYPSFPLNRGGCSAQNRWCCFSAVPLFQKDLCPPHLLSDCLVPEPHTSSRKFQSYLSNLRKRRNFSGLLPAFTFKTPLTHSCLYYYPAAFWVHLLLHPKGGSRLPRVWDHSVSEKIWSISCLFTWILHGEVVSATDAQNKMHLQSSRLTSTWKVICENYASLLHVDPQLHTRHPSWVCS